MRLIFFLTIFMIAILTVFTAGHAADIKKYLFLPSFDLVEERGAMTLQVNQRVIIRLQRTRGVKRTSLGQEGRDAPKVKLEERKLGKCINIAALVGFSPGPSESLEFITKDRKRIRAYLSDNCRAKEFYAGAYIEKPKDGKLCRKRDIVHARYGAECQLDRFRLLVPETS